MSMEMASRLEPSDFHALLASFLISSCPSVEDVRTDLRDRQLLDPMVVVFEGIAHEQIHVSAPVVPGLAGA
jgi:hypothetical protein